MSKIAQAAQSYCRANNLDLASLDAPAQQRVIDAVAAQTAVDPATVRAELVSQWTEGLATGRSASAQLGGGVASSTQARPSGSSALQARLSNDDPGMRGVRARVSGGRLRGVRSDQLVRNNPTLRARAPDLIELMGDKTIGDLRARFGGMSLSKIARLSQPERKARLEGPGKGVYFNRLAQEIEDQVRALDPNGKAPLTAAEFDALPFRQQREVMELLSGLDEATLASVTRKARPSASDPLLAALGLKSMPSFVGKLDEETAAICEFLDENWSVSVKARPEPKQVEAPVIRPDDGWTVGTAGRGLESIDAGAALRDVVQALLVEGARMGVPIVAESMNMAISSHNLRVTMANAYGVEGGVEIDVEAPEKYADFSSASEQIINFLQSQLSLRAAPKDYAAIKRGDKEPGQPTEFEGDDLHSRLGASCFDFADSLSAANVQYSDEEQGRSPLTELVGAVLRQGMNMTIKGMYQELIDPLNERSAALSEQIDAARPPRPSSASRPTSDRRARLRELLAALRDEA